MFRIVKRFGSSGFHVKRSSLEWESYFNSKFSHGLIREHGITLDNHGVPDTTKENPIKQVKMNMKVTDNMLAPTGLVHGAAISLLADTAIGFGCHCFLRSPSNKFAVSNMNIHFLQSAKLGDTVSVTATQLHGGRSTQTWDATLTCNNSLLSTVRSSAINLEKKEVNTDNENKSRAGEFYLHKMDKKQIAQKFDELAPNWEKYVDKYNYTPVFEWLRSNCESQLPSLLKVSPNTRLKVVDLACGIGLISKCLKNNGFTDNNSIITGIDISPGMLKRALDNSIYNGGIILQDIENIPLPIDSLSVTLVTFCGAIELMKNHEFIIDECSRIIKLNGQLWITFQSSEIHNESTKHQGIKGVDKNYIFDLLENRNFMIKECELVEKSFETPYINEKGEKMLLPVPYYFVKAIKI